MFRAEVVSVPAVGRADIRIWKRYRDSVISDVQSSVDVSAGDRVVVADLAERSHVADWWIVGFESEIGRWFQAAPHEHPQGEVVGLVDRLAALEARLDALEP